MLFVLLIVMLLSFMTIPVLHDTYHENEMARFFEVLDSDIRFIQNQAIKGRELAIYLDKDHYEILEERRKVLETREYPKTFEAQRFASEPITFWNTGTIKIPKTYIFRTTNGEKYKVVFPFGKGRQYIETM